MKIVVAVKQVAVLDEEFELLDDGAGVDPDAIEWELNEWDEFSLEAALQLREAQGEGEVVVDLGRDEEAEEGLRACLAKGADRALRIWDDALAGADALAVARVLAAAVERESPDLVLCGVQSSDAVHSATGVALAAHLGLPRVAVVKALDYDAGRDSATVERELEGGLIELLRVRCPRCSRSRPASTSRATRICVRSSRPRRSRSRSSSRASSGSTGTRSQRRRARACARWRRPTRAAARRCSTARPSAVAERIAEIVKERMSG